MIRYKLKFAAVAAAFFFISPVLLGQDGDRSANCGLQFDDLYDESKTIGWTASYIDGGGTHSGPSTSLHKVNVTSGTDPYFGSLPVIRPGASSSLKLGNEAAGANVTSIVSYSAAIDNSNQYLTLNYAVVARILNSIEGSPSMYNGYFKFELVVTEPGSSSTPVSQTIHYTDIVSAATLSGSFDYKSRPWTSILLDMTSFAPGSSFVLTISCYSGSTTLGGIYGYVDVVCHPGPNYGADVCSTSGWSFYEELMDTGGYTGVWHFGDGNTATLPLGVHTYAPSPISGGSYVPYIVTLDLTDPNGNTVTLVIAHVTVYPTVTGNINVSVADCGKFQPYTFSHPAINNPETSWVWDFGDGSPTSTETSPTHVYGAIGTYEVTLTFADGDKCNRTKYEQAIVTNCPIDCQDCITDFSLPPGQYIISAWVSQGMDGYEVITNYDEAVIEVNTSITQTFHAAGPVIDGWQRLEGTFEITDDSPFSFTLSSSEHDVYFDDIRIFPYDGSMMSYVYDPGTLRLMAELDERNYAKFYEYNEEGKLIRVKKETERGVMTIQENTENSAGHD